MNETRRGSILRTTSLWVARLEDSLLVAMLLVMLLAAVAQILLRNVFSSGIAWADALVRISVLWAGLLGAMVAARENSHIHIDLISRYLPERVQKGSAAIVELFAAAVCFFTGWHGASWVRMEFADHTTAFSQVPMWLTAVIIPVAFFLMGARYLAWSGIHLTQALKRRP